MKASKERTSAVEQLARECRYDWRKVLLSLENDSLSLTDDPWEGLEPYLHECDEGQRREFDETLQEMVQRGSDADRILAFSVLIATTIAFDFTPSLALEKEFSESSDVYLEWILVLGQRGVDAGEPAVARALENQGVRHAAAIAYCQIHPEKAGEIGREMFEKDRAEIIASLSRPLREHDYSTFLQMAEGVSEVRGKAGLNTFLRAVAGDDPGLAHALAPVAGRVLRQHRPS